MAPGEDIDSGMESQSASSSNDLTPEKPKSGSKELLEKQDLTDDEDLDDDDLDETLSERLWGLTEMFPEGVRNLTSKLVNGTCAGVKGFYQLSRSATWIFFSSSVILFAPLIFEVERAQMEEMQRSQQKQVLLGPNSALSSGGISPGIGLMPPVPR